MIESTLFCAFTLGIFFGIILVPKSDSKLNLITWLPIALLLLVCIDALAAALLSLLSIPVNIVSIAIFNAALSVVCFTYIFKIKKRQQYTVVMLDVVVLVVCLIVVLICGYIQFGTDLRLNFATSDPSMHLWDIVNIVNTETVSKMYLAYLPVALAIEVVAPVIPVLNYYSVFIVCEIFFLFLAAAVFYSVVRRYVSERRDYVIALFLTLFYVLAYPLNNTVFGFCYLGFAVTVIAMLCFGALLYTNREVSSWFSIGICSLALFGVIICYSLFAPFVYIATCIFFVVSFKRAGKILSRKNIIQIGVLFVPGIALGFIFAYLGLFGGELSATTAIAYEGFVYRDLYSNFVIVAPFFIYALYHLYKHKELSLEKVLFFVLLSTMIIALILGLQGSISSYYFYKFYYLMWLVCLVLATQGILILVRTGAKRLLATYCAVWFLVIFLAVSGFDSDLHNANIKFNQKAKAWEYLDIYAFNITEMRSDAAVPKDMLALFETAHNYQQDGDTVPLVADWNIVYWYQAITNQAMENYYTLTVPVPVYQENLMSNTYVAVISESDAESLADPVINDKEVVFSNSAGYIVKMN